MTPVPSPPSRVGSWIDCDTHVLHVWQPFIILRTLRYKDLSAFPALWCWCHRVARHRPIRHLPDLFKIGGWRCSGWCILHKRIRPSLPAAAVEIFSPCLTDLTGHFGAVGEH